MSTTLSVRLPDSLSSRLASAAIETERSKSYLLQKALEYYLEDVADLQIANDRLRSAEPEIELDAAIRALQA